MSDLRVVPTVQFSLSTLWDHRRFAVAISWPWVAVSGLLKLALFLSYPALADPFLWMKPGSLNGAVPGWILNVQLFVWLCMFSTVGVNWHRYLLRGDATRRPWHIDWIVFRYGKTAFFIGMGVMIASAFFVLFAVWPIKFLHLTGFPRYLAIGIAFLVSCAVLGTILVRLGVVLPGIAVEEAYPWMAVKAGQGHSLRMLGVGLILSVIGFGLGIVAIALPYGLWLILGPQSVIGISLLAVAESIANWLNLFVNITIITVLYGVLMEERDV